tara:strand:- start:164 stop:562 length:399 start_codon:yes stop_codon:yes gene_type:complete
MNEQISWDPSLVKKFSSSNHFKMLNQLRNEVKKYPLTKKKNISTNINVENKNTNRSKPNNLNSKHESVSKSPSFNNQTTISFNNSKNFSIYNNINNDLDNEPSHSVKSDEKKSNEDFSFTSFKERLNQIDMK